VTLATENRSSDLWLKRDLIVLPAIVANDLKAFRSRLTFRSLLRAALRTTLRSHHVALVENLLLLFGKQESFFALNARGFYVRHMVFSLNYQYERGDARILTQVRKYNANAYDNASAWT
jgi:hypothetical protein